MFIVLIFETPFPDTRCQVRASQFRWYQSQGLGGSGIEYMIEKHVFSNVLA